jgi:hypothetical protein
MQGAAAYIMPEQMLLNLALAAVREYGHVHGVDTSGWSVRPIESGICSVSGIATEQDAIGFKRWLGNQPNLMTDVLPPDEAVADWTVVAAV